MVESVTEKRLDLQPGQDAMTEDEKKIYNLLEDVANKILTPFAALMKLEAMVE